MPLSHYTRHPAPRTTHYTLHFTLHTKHYSLHTTLHTSHYTLRTTRYNFPQLFRQLSRNSAVTFPQLCCLPVAWNSVSPVPQVYSWLTYTIHFEALAVPPGTTLRAKCCHTQFLAVVAHISEGSKGNAQEDVLASLIADFSFLRPALRSVGFTIVDSNNDNDDDNTAISYYVKRSLLSELCTRGLSQLGQNPFMSGIRIRFNPGIRIRFGFTVEGLR